MRGTQVRLNFRPDPPDQNIDHLGIDGQLLATRSVEQLLTRKDDSRVSKEEHEQTKLGWTKGHALAHHRQLPRPHINEERSARFIREVFLVT